MAAAAAAVTADATEAAAAAAASSAADDVPAGIDFSKVKEALAAATIEFLRILKCDNASEHQAASVAVSEFLFMEMAKLARDVWGFKKER